MIYKLLDKKLFSKVSPTLLVVASLLAGIFIGTFIDKPSEEPANSYRTSGDYIELTYDGEVYYEVGLVGKEREWLDSDGENIHNWDGFGLNGRDLTAIYKLLKAKRCFKEKDG